MFRSLHHRLWFVLATTLILPWLAAGFAFLPGPFFLDWFRYTGESNFIAGLMPPLVAAVVVALTFRRRITKPHGLRLICVAIVRADLDSFPTLGSKRVRC